MSNNNGLCFTFAVNETMPCTNADKLCCDWLYVQTEQHHRRSAQLLQRRQALNNERHLDRAHK